MYIGNPRSMYLDSSIYYFNKNPVHLYERKEFPHLRVTILTDNCLVICIHIHLTRYSCLEQFRNPLINTYRQDIISHIQLKRNSKQVKDHWKAAYSLLIRRNYYNMTRLNPSIMLIAVQYFPATITCNV